MLSVVSLRSERTQGVNRRGQGDGCILHRVKVALVVTGIEREHDFKFCSPPLYVPPAIRRPP